MNERISNEAAQIPAQLTNADVLALLASLTGNRQFATHRILAAIPTLRHHRLDAIVRMRGC